MSSSSTAPSGQARLPPRHALGALEAGAQHPHAVIDADSVRRFWPAPHDDPFQVEVELTNLRDLAANYRAAGAQHLIVAGVIEEPAEVPRYAMALQAERMLVCRLVADASVLEARLRARHTDDRESRDWHLNRAGELAAILDAAAVDDVVIDTTAGTPREVATLIAAAAGWASASSRP